MDRALSMWTCIASWFTPTVLFCVLNLMIGTIFLTSNFKTQHRKTEDDHQHHHNSSAPGPLFRAPSLLERVKSINFNPYRSEFPNPSQAETQQTTPLFRAPSLLERVKSINFNPYKSELPNPEEPETQHADLIHQADTPARTSKLDRNRPAILRKSASEKRKVEEADEVDRRRPMTVRERHPRPMAGGDEAVDAKADDFINRFKNQLKLQRLDSFIRYKEMLQRGASR